MACFDYTLPLFQMLFERLSVVHLWSGMLLGESMPGNLREWIFEKSGEVRGWLCSSRYGGAMHSQTMTHPDDADLIPKLVERALLKTGLQRWLVPRYQTHLILLLTHLGFKGIGAYSMLKKNVTVRLSYLHYARLEAIV
jgi:hypothetical protein